LQKREWGAAGDGPLADRLVVAPGKGLRAGEDAGDVRVLAARGRAALLSLFRALDAALLLGDLLFLLAGLAKALVD
jgi:hypothetical protein